MKNFFKIVVLMPLVFCAQGVLAASYSDGFYSAPSPATANMNINNAQLQNEMKIYNSELNGEFEKLKKEFTQSDPMIQRQTQEGSAYQQFARPQTTQMQKPTLQNSTKLQPQNSNNFKNNPQRAYPDWWRQENSFQGWGFD